MGDVINLNQVRKARQRQEKSRTASENRAKFGRTKADRQREAAEADRIARELAGKRSSPPDDGGDKAN